jgi:hypothetical protein
MMASFRAAGDPSADELTLEAARNRRCSKGNRRVDVREGALERGLT